MAVTTKRESIRKWIVDAGKKVWKNRLFVLLGIAGLYLLAVVGNWALYPDAVRILETGFADKTLWDWMDLLIVSVVLTFGVLALNYSQRKNEQAIAKESREQDRDIAEKNRETDREIARDRQYQTTLETYFDRMADLLLKENLRNSGEGDEVRSIARTRTLAVLRSLDAERVGAVFRFIDDAELKDVISLKGGNLMEVKWMGADLYGATLSDAFLFGATLSDAFLFGATLSDAHLSWAHLDGAHLDDANLSGALLLRAHLRGADLDKANLDGADLSEADLRGAVNYTDKQLREANSLKGATMPDGTKYEEWIKTHGEDGQAQSQEADEQPIVDDQSSE